MKIFFLALFLSAAAALSIELNPTAIPVNRTEERTIHLTDQHKWIWSALYNTIEDSLCTCYRNIRSKEISSLMTFEERGFINSKGEEYTWAELIVDMLKVANGMDHPSLLKVIPEFDAMLLYIEVIPRPISDLIEYNHNEKYIARLKEIQEMIPGIVADRDNDPLPRLDALAAEINKLSLEHRLLWGPKACVERMNNKTL